MGEEERYKWKNVFKSVCVCVCVRWDSFISMGKSGKSVCYGITDIQNDGFSVAVCECE